MNITSAVTVDTPDGDFTMLLRDGSVLAAGWTNDSSSLIALMHPSLQPEPNHIEFVDAGVGDSDIEAAVAAVAAYYAGELAAPADIPVLQQSGEFRKHTWDVLREVAPGKPVTYAQLAQRAGRPAAVRAAAGACALNAAALFVPCHRVLRANGGLGGFRYGLNLKQKLLNRETDPEHLGVLF